MYDPPSSFGPILALARKAWTGIRILDLCDAGAVLHQLNYQVNSELVFTRVQRCGP